MRRTSPGERVATHKNNSVPCRLILASLTAPSAAWRVGATGTGRINLCSGHLAHMARSILAPHGELARSSVCHVAYTARYICRGICRSNRTLIWVLAWGVLSMTQRTTCGEGTPCTRASLESGFGFWFIARDAARETKKGS